MLDCDQALELISAELDGALTAEERAGLEAHLAVCPACRTLQADFEALHLELPGLAAQPPADLKENVMEAVRRSKVTPFQGKKKQWRWRSLASLAAVLALMVVGGSAMRQWEGAASRADQGPTAGGERAVVQNTGAPAAASLPEVAQEEQARTYSGQQEALKTGLTRDEAVKELALFLGWQTDGLTADGEGRLAGPEGASITCAGLNEDGTGWLCQVEKEGGSAAAYIVALDGSGITAIS